MELTHAYLGNIQHKRGDDGFLYVTGLVSNDALDLDQQRCDPDWLDVAVPKWAQVGNVRLMHTSHAVGKAKEISKAGTGWNAAIKVTDKQSAIDVEEGVLTGLSIGIKNPVVEKSMSAPNGLICGGTIVEVSLVDRPANPECILEMAKMAKSSWVFKGVEVSEANHNDLIVTEQAVTDKEDDQNGALPCNACSGTGKTSEVPGETCARCSGSGQEPLDEVDNDIAHSDATGDAYDNLERQKSATVDCTTCEGDGKIKGNTTECPDCDGSGKVKKEIDPELEKAIDAVLAKRDFSDAERKTAASKGQAMPDGSFPIKNVGDLKNAIQSIGRAKDPVAAKAHIKSRAKDLGQSALIPDGWKSASGDEVPFLIKFVDDVLAKAAGSAGEFTHDPTQIAAVRDGIIAFFIAELNEFKSGEDERWDIGILTDVLNGWLSWWQHEYFGGETSSPFDTGDDDMTNALVTFGANADLLKRASADDATDDTKNEAKADVFKALGFDTIIASQKEEVESLKSVIEELTKSVNTISEFALPADDVVVRPTSDQRRKSVTHDIVKGQIKQLRDRADATTEPSLKASLYVKADDLEASLL